MSELSAAHPLSARQTQELYEFGRSLIAETRELILTLWNARSFSAELKADQTPVTEVDLRAEELIRKRIAQTYPSHGVIGEELGTSNPESEFQWAVDPIDGTLNLANLIPTFGTLLGLRYRGTAILGFIDHPALDLTCSGGAGLGVAINGKPVPKFPEAVGSGALGPMDIIATSTYNTFERTGEGSHLISLMQFHEQTRIYYDCYAHTLTVAGSLAATVEYGLKIWDLTPAEALLPELGGAFRYLSRPSDAASLPNSVAGKTAGDGAAGLYHAVFGRTAAVAAITDHLAPLLKR